jgi:hypothetical protein
MTPELPDVSDPAAMSLLPSAEDATDVQKTPVTFKATLQNVPDELDVYRLPSLSAATALTPSLDMATAVHFRLPTLGVHVAPESEEAKMGASIAAAINFVPSADDAIAVQSRGVSLAVQVSPESADV